MARDDEFRRVAEDVGALARSLARDFREAVDQARSSGRSTSEALRHGIRGVADETRRGVAGGWQPPPRRPKHHHHRRAYYYPGPFPNGSGPYGNRGPGDDSYDPADPQSERRGSSPEDDWGQAGYAWPFQGPGGPPPWATRRGRAPRDRKPREEKSKASRRSTLPPIRRRWDATTVVGVLAVLFGIAWLLGALRLTHVSAEAVIAIGLMFLGAALVVTGRTDWSLSRRTWPVWLGAGLIGALLITSSTFGMGGSLQDVSFGTMNSTVSGPGNHTVHGGFGKLTVDASGITGPSTLTVDSVAGQTTITFRGGNVPAWMAIDAKVLAGQICVDGKRVAGGVSSSYHRPASAAATPSSSTGAPAVSSVLDVHQVAGQVLIGSQECSR